MRAARTTPTPASALDRGAITKARRLIAQPGCPLCRVRDDAVTHAIAWLWVEGYNDWEWRERLATSAGMCREHWWQAMTSERSHAFGASSVAESFTHAALHDLAQCEQELRARTESGGADGVRYHPRQWWTWLRSLRGTRSRTGAGANAGAGACPLCETAALEERVALRRLFLALADSEAWADYERSDGLCLTHLRWALNDSPADPLAHAVAVALITDTRRRLGALAEEFARFFHTMDYRFHDEPRGSEQTAWLRGVERFTGPAPQHACGATPHDTRDAAKGAPQEAHP